MRKLGKDITEELLLGYSPDKTGFEGPAPMTLSSSLSLPPGIPQAAVYLAEMTVTQVILKLIDNSYEPMSPETQTQMAAEVYESIMSQELNQQGLAELTVQKNIIMRAIFIAK